MTRKKGVSIGESLRGRMSTVNQDTSEPDDSPMQMEIAEQKPGHRTPPDGPTVMPSQPIDSLESFNTRLRQSTHRRLKVHCAINGIKIQEFVNEALEAYLLTKEE